MLDLRRCAKIALQWSGPNRQNWQLVRTSRFRRTSINGFDCKPWRRGDQERDEPRSWSPRGSGPKRPTQSRRGPHCQPMQLTKGELWRTWDHIANHHSSKSRPAIACWQMWSQSPRGSTSWIMGQCCPGKNVFQLFSSPKVMCTNNVAQ